ncbi:MAG: energy-coupling factor transporter ATPase, partial [Eubacterium sp.]|nr:energy-coupling factor transporter ATPase [Eubacterium sp.]
YVKRLIVMNEGTIQLDGRVEEVFSHHRELETMGLRAPQVTYVMEGLAARGISLPHNAVTMQQAVSGILEAAGAVK